MKQNIDTIVKELRAEGNKVKITHYRHVNNHSTVLSTISTPGGFSVAPTRTLKELRLMQCAYPNGGLVHAEIETPSGKKVAGQSHCSLSDNFNKRIGTTIALGRAVAELKQERQNKLLC